MNRTDMDAKDAEGAGRSAYYEDPAKPVWVGLPFMVAAAAALLILGHLYNRRPGRRGGVDPAKPAACGSSNKSKQTDDRLHDLALEELRRRRAEAAEARLQRGATNDGPGVATPTPLGRILMLCRKVDALEVDAKHFFDSLNSESLLQDELQEKRRLIDAINHLQLEIDSVQVDESVGPHRKVQSARLQHLLADLGKFS